MNDETALADKGLAEMQETMHQLMTFAALARLVPAAELAQAIEMAEAIAPILNPTLYRATAPKLTILKRIAENLVVFQRGLPTIQECVDADLQQAAALKLT